MIEPHMINVLAEPEARNWEQGWCEITEGFGEGWRWPTSQRIYQELYRQLSHGHGMSPDDALAVLGAAYYAAEREMS